MKQTAVEWLVEKMTQQDFIAIPKPEWIEQAKAMEKEQMMQCYEDGYNRVAKLIENATQRNLNL